MPRRGIAQDVGSSARRLRLPAGDEGLQAWISWVTESDQIGLANASPWRSADRAWRVKIGNLGCETGTHCLLDVALAVGNHVAQAVCASTVLAAWAALSQRWACLSGKARMWRVTLTRPSTNPTASRASKHQSRPLGNIPRQGFANPVICASDLCTPKDEGRACARVFCPTKTAPPDPLVSAHGSAPRPSLSANLTRQSDPYVNLPLGSRRRRTCGGFGGSGLR